MVRLGALSVLALAALQRTLAVEEWMYDRLATFEEIRERERQEAAAAERAARKVQREADAVAAAAAAAAAAEEAAAAAAAADAAALKRAAYLKKTSEAAAHVETLRKSAAAEAALNYFSIHRDSYKYHVTQEFSIKPKTALGYCMTVPAALTTYTYRNGLGVILAPCNTSDTTQLFSYDPTSHFIHPEESKTFCLDFDTDKQNNRPLTVFRCDKTFSASAKPRHQEWTFANGTNIMNTGTGKCIATGTGTVGHHDKVYEGKGVQQYDCNTIKQQYWNWVPRKWYKALDSGRSFIH